MSTSILTFICGVGVGFAAAFITITLVNARRRRFFGVPNHRFGEWTDGSMVANQEIARQQAEQWRRDNPDVVKTWQSSQTDFEAALRGKRNDEPTELDQ